MAGTTTGPHNDEQENDCLVGGNSARYSIQGRCAERGRNEGHRFNLDADEFLVVVFFI